MELEGSLPHIVWLFVCLFVCLCE